MTKVKDITDYLESLFPLTSALGFDNPGIQVGFPNNDIDRCIVCLDTTSSVVDAAMELNASLVFSHHPLLFDGIKSISVEDSKGRIISKLIRGGISCYAAHTNLDADDEFSNSILAKRIGLSDVYSSEDVFCGVFGSLDISLTMKDFCKQIEESLNSSGVITYSIPENMVNKVFVQGGSFDEDVIPVLVKEGVDTVVSGEIKHHIMLELEELGIKGVIAGHNATERIFMENLVPVLEKQFPNVEFVYFDGTERRF